MCTRPTTQLDPDDVDPELAQLARARATKRELADHRMAWLASATGFDLHADDSKPWPRMVEVAIQIPVRHIDDSTYSRLSCALG